MKISLVKINNEPVSVCTGGYSMAIQDGKVIRCESQYSGAKHFGKMAEYLKNENEMELAWELQCFDETINN